MQIVLLEIIYFKHYYFLQRNSDCWHNTKDQYYSSRLNIIRLLFGISHEMLFDLIDNFDTLTLLGIRFRRYMFDSLHLLYRTNIFDFSILIVIYYDKLQAFTKKIQVHTNYIAKEKKKFHTKQWMYTIYITNKRRKNSRENIQKCN